MHITCRMRILSVTQFSAHHCCKAAARHMEAAARKAHAKRRPGTALRLEAGRGVKSGEVAQRGNHGLTANPREKSNHV